MIKRFLFIFFWASSAYAQERLVIPFEMPSARAEASGGFHSALTDDFQSAFFNPAGFAALNPVKLYSETSLQIKSVENVYNLYLDKFSGDALLRLIRERIEAGIVLGGPLCFGGINNGFGWRVYNAFRLNFSWDNNNVFVVRPMISEEFAAAFGYGLRLVDYNGITLDAGAFAQGFYRIVYEPEDVFVQELRHFFAEIDQNPYATEIGVSFNAGLRWTKNDNFSLAFSCRNLAPPVYTSYHYNLYKLFQSNVYKNVWGRMTPGLQAGFTVRFPSEIMHRWNTDLIFSADYSGIYELFAGSEKDLLLFIGAGIELRILEVLSLRGGWSEWSPCGGIGIDFTSFLLDISVSGKPISGSINDKKIWSISLNLSFMRRDYLADH
ncbi:MAG: hypothetical protein LBG79_08145 [Spirochaetaceae bacterium]|nr:hypothetical protein [Spirochaetaceae bacterium]GMO28195.1 MAG: hypothetical protein Pg6A_16020 [Termitinemataceae bacterium]